MYLKIKNLFFAVYKNTTISSYHKCINTNNFLIILTNYMYMYCVNTTYVLINQIEIKSKKP